MATTAAAGARGEVDERESHLRVLAACCTMIILGWAAYSAARLPATFTAPGLGPRFLMGAGFLWSFFWAWFPLARALGRSRTRTSPWTMTFGYVFYLPFLSLLKTLPGPGFETRWSSWSPVCSLGAASTLVLLGLAIAGWRLERRDARA